MSILLWYFDLITATAEKPTSHKYDVANDTKARRALRPTSANSDRAFVAVSNPLFMLTVFLI